MSALQLDELWQYESFLANALLDLPLRTCASRPSPTWGRAMSPTSFVQLRSDIRKMWCKAAQIFTTSKSLDEDGFGLKVRDDLGSML